MPLNSETSLYNRQHLEAVLMVREHLKGLSEDRVAGLRILIQPYLLFRQAVEAFQKRHFAALCTVKCFSSHESACCGREGIAAFFADVVVNLLLSGDAEVDRLLAALSVNSEGPNCVYLEERGCIWRMKPIACEMFLCDQARERVFGNRDDLRTQWERFRREERQFTWPSNPVLFDQLEEIFIQAGYDSPLMYLHKSPGLLRIKKGGR